MSNIEDALKATLLKYKESFNEKIYEDKYDEVDVLMDAFGITQDLKSENKQYWGRELGKCWENLLRLVFELHCKDYNPPIRFGADEPADFFIGKEAVDTKYRVGSGDSGTLKKFEMYGKMLKDQGYDPVFLFLRTDNLPAALSKMTAGGWTMYFGDDTFQYILNKTNFDLKAWLIKIKEEQIFKIER